MAGMELPRIIVDETLEVVSGRRPILKSTAVLSWGYCQCATWGTLVGRTESKVFVNEHAFRSNKMSKTFTSQMFIRFDNRRDNGCVFPPIMYASFYNA